MEETALQRASTKILAEMELFKGLIAPPGTPEAQIKLAYAYAQRLGLDPLRKQVMIIKVQGQYQIVVGIHGMGAIVSRHIDYRGTQSGCVYAEEEFFISSGGEVNHISKPHKQAGNPIGAWATTTRDLGGTQVRFTVYLRWQDYVRTNSDSWQKQGPWMLEKTARAFSQREAYPDLLLGVYAPEEFGSKSVELESVRVDTLEDSPTSGPQPVELSQEQLAPPATTQPTDDNSLVESFVEDEDDSIFGPKKVCTKCGGEIIEYKAKSGIWYAQCVNAREAFLKDRSMASTKGHYIEKIKSADDPPF